MTLYFNSLVNLQVNCRSSFGNTNILLFLCQWLDYFLTGLFLGFIYKKYKNIWINISIHGTWNPIGAGMILTKIMLTK